MSLKKKLPRTQIDIENYFNSEHITLEMIDVRSPLEFEVDHIPGAINCPALSDNERAKVGKIYANDTFEAKRIGAALICKNIALFLETIWKNKPRHWTPVIYCWRGGNRSKSVAHVLEKVGWKALVLQGGYKSYRKYVVNQIPQFLENMSFIVVCGLTGSGKTKFLNYLVDRKKQIIDLEGLASHRGSLLGRIPSKNQPSQKMFESLLLECLKKLKKNKPIYVESESKKIGDVQIPEPLINHMRKSSCIWIETADEERIKFLCKEYSHFVRDVTSLKKIVNQLQRINQLSSNLCCDNLEISENLNRLVKELLTKHYDPSYKKSMQKNYQRLSEAKKLYMKNAEPLNYSEVFEEEASLSEKRSIVISN